MLKSKILTKNSKYEIIFLRSMEVQNKGIFHLISKIYIPLIFSSFHHSNWNEYYPEIVQKILRNNVKQRVVSDAIW